MNFILGRIWKTAIAAILTAAFVLPCAPALAAEFARPELRIALNGKLLSPAVKPVVVNGGPYAPLRYLSELLGAHVGWNRREKRATVYANGKEAMPNAVLQNGHSYASPEFFSVTFGLQAEYFAGCNILVFSAKGSPKHSEEDALRMRAQYMGYTQEDLHWLSKIVEAEAGGETYDSRLGVASVILNRRESGMYPTTVKAVIFDRKNGVQFTPVMNGAVYNQPSNLSILAAIEALEGRNNAPEALFFLNPRYAKSSWVQRNREYGFSIGGHSYYY